MSKKEAKDYGTHVAFLATNSTREGGKRQIKRDTFVTFMENEGISRGVLDSMAEAEETLAAAAVELCTADLVAAIADAKKAGDDATGLKSRVAISTLGGSTEVAMAAQRSYPNRFAKDAEGNPIVGATSTKFGIVDVSVDATKRIPNSTIEKAASLVEQALGA